LKRLSKLLLKRLPKPRLKLLLKRARNKNKETPRNAVAHY
jgi:hypothetical protein